MESKALTTKQIFEKAADLIESSGFSQGAYARNQHGDIRPYLSNEASSFCAIGAIYRVSEEDDNTISKQNGLQAREILRSKIDCVPSWNDENTAETVVATLRTLAAEQKSKQK